MASFAATVASSSIATIVQAAPMPPSTIDLTLFGTLGSPTIFNEFLK